MSQIRWYIDEDSSDTGLVRSLQNQAIDVVTVQSANRRGYLDEAQLIWAAEQGRVLYSSNIKDFYRLHTNFLVEGQLHAGMMLVQQQRYSVGAIARGILRLMDAKSAEDMQNQVEFLSDWIED
ncbi:hypothetical protein BCD67_10545 [Oscillatoriales cyanobacterium USR001]|nr:hypothetical protein BCD67_10545 [Oscillatoriales cyanobacterium USR001]